MPHDDTKLVAYMTSDYPAFDFALTYDSTLEQLFTDYRFFVRRTGMGGATERRKSRFKQGDALNSNSSAKIEEYSTIGDGVNLFTIGSFSSVASAMPQYTNVGRYSSIGPRQSFTGYRHPIHAASQNSIVFNPSREYVHAYLTDFNSKNESEVSLHPIENPQPKRSLHIGHDVWIGSDCLISPGITIGNGSIIASRSIVVKDVPAYSIYGGSPAKKIRPRFDENIAAAMEETQWWNYELGDILSAGINFQCPEEFLSAFTSEFSRLRLTSVRSFSPLTRKEVGKSAQLFSTHGHVVRKNKSSLSTDRDYTNTNNILQLEDCISAGLKVEQNPNGTYSLFDESGYVSIHKSGRIFSSPNKSRWEEFIVS